jgi:hypothetical protein
MNLRNTQKPNIAKIMYMNGKLSVPSLSLSLSQYVYICVTYGMAQVYMDAGGAGVLTPCLEISVDLPTGYYFGLSAATGGLAGQSHCSSALLLVSVPVPVSLCLYL